MTIGTFAIGLYLVATIAALVWIGYHTVIVVRQVYRERQLARELDEVKRQAYREHHGGKDAAL